MIRLAIFASGNGSNAENIAKYFSDKKDIEISLIVSNNADAYVLQRAVQLNIPTYTFDRDTFYKTDELLQKLASNEIDFLTLAGFMWLIPSYLVEAYEDRILNIHPALLPKFGGKGMYGDHVHKAVKLAGEKETGITIHKVNEHYDEGAIVFQSKCYLTEEDTYHDIAQKVHALEYEHYPVVIESEVLKSFKND